jgi:carbon-monoxide dehydrogenase small subunit
MQSAVTLHVNGRAHALQVRNHHTLLTVLREQLGLLGPREGCGVGMCGACTVLIDGNPVSACLVLAALAEGRQILTVEGLSHAERGTLHPLQQAFLEGRGFQCSFCTPGFILAAKSLLESNPDASEEEIRDYLAGNLCRCGSYVKIMDSVKLAQARARAGEA